MRAQREARHYAPASAASALERPEQIRVRAGFHNAPRAPRRADLALQKPGGRGAEAFGKAAKPAALNEARHADVGAAAALHVASRLAGDGVIEVDPHGAGLGGDGGTGRDLAFAALRRESIMQRHL